MDLKQTFLNELCELNAILAANTVYGGYNPHTIENIQGKVDAYSVATLLAYGKIQSVKEVELEENQEYLHNLIKVNIENGFRTGKEKLDYAILYSYQLT